MRARRTSTRNKQRGVALVEAAITLTVLSLLGFALVLLAGLIDLQHATVAGARSAAFDCVRAPIRCSAQPGGIDGLANDVRARHFTGPRREVLAQQTLAATVASDGQRVHGWRGGSHVAHVAADGQRASTSDSMLRSYGDIGLAIQRQGLNRPRSEVERGLNGSVIDVAATVIGAGPAVFGLDYMAGVVRSDLQVGLTPPTRWQTELGQRLVIKDRIAVLGDGWDAAGPADVQQRVERGQSPGPLGQISRIYHASVLYALMPIAEVIRLDRDTASFRDGYGHVDSNLPMSGKYRAD